LYLLGGCMQFSKFSYLSFELTGQHSANSIIILPFHFLGICGIASTNGVRLEGIVSGDGVHWRSTCGGGVAIAPSGRNQWWNSADATARTRTRGSSIQIRWRSSGDRYRWHEWVTPSTFSHPDKLNILGIILALSISRWQRHRRWRRTERVGHDVVSIVIPFGGVSRLV